MKKIMLSCILVLLFSIFNVVFAEDKSNSFSAEQFINDWYSELKQGNAEKAGNVLSPDFLSVHTDQLVRNKAQEIELIKKLKMSSYKLSDFKVNQSGNVMVVTYKDLTSEIIDNKPVEHEPALRMTILQKLNDKWLIIALANLDPIDKKK